MARNPQIRITENDRKEYARLVKNTKAKVRRTVKNVGAVIQDVQNGEIVQVDIREKMNIPSLDSFSTREAFNNWKYETEKFNKGTSSHANFKKNKYGIAVTEHLTIVAENLNKKEQKNAKKLRDKITKQTFVSGGVEQGTMEQRLLTMGRNNPNNIRIPNDFDFSGIRSISRLKDLFEGMKKRADKDEGEKRLERMKDNFIRLLEESFNSEANRLIEKIRNMPADDFYEMYLMFDEFDFDLYYNENGDPYGEHPQLKQMESYLEQYEGDVINFDLKGF